MSAATRTSFAQMVRTNVVSDGAGRLLPRVYVKVYGRSQGGRITFYKDGYTDLRGRFDYTSLSTDALDQVERLSLLVLSADCGALIQEVAPPAR